ncbi:MAG: acyl-CoA thioesterase [Bacteroidetes bacterium]|nr:acyl-CoA thioesterase [Bacteroidota bacterium]MBS1930517.1 acyl-CoA thioesterase [Bacteroidota bacterium]
MSRLKIVLPPAFSFSTKIPVRINDLNYGGHVGNDAILTFIHEARMQFLGNWGYSELDFAGVGLIMSDVMIEFKSELFYGDIVVASVVFGEFGKVGFDLFYKLEKEQNGKLIVVATSKTGMVCYDYQKKKVVPVPEQAKSKMISI